METNLVAEFIKSTGAKPNDAISCLQTWGWDLKKALIDYNDTSTTNYFKNKTNNISNGNINNNNSSDNSTSDSETTSNTKNLTNNFDDESSMKSPPVITRSRHNSTNSTISQQLVPPTVVQRRQQQLKENRRENNVSYSTSSGKPLLAKSDSIDLVDYKKLARGISRATDNVNIVSRARSEFAMDFHTKQQPTASYMIDTPDYTFTLPDLSVYEEDFRKFLEKDLIECATLNSLENTNRLNWWNDIGNCRKLWPLATSGDGNCLLHAASLAMWGFHDRRLTLRRALHAILSEGDYRDSLWRRWRFQQTKQNREAGLVFSDTEWAREWEEIVAIASPEPRQARNNTGSARRRSVIVEKPSNESVDTNAVYESLEEIHVLALAYVLRRAIIVISDVVLRDINGEALAPIPFGGVYLPYDIENCHKVPLLLAYDMAHFSALVTMALPTDNPAAFIPLIDHDSTLLPLQFCIDPGENFNWREYDGREGYWALSEVEHIALLKEYLEIVYSSPTAGSPDDELYDDVQSDEEYDRKVTEMALNARDETQYIGGSGQQQKSKLQTVAKQFGSIGKSMSKKIKNIGSLTKFSGAKNTHPQLSGKSSNSSNSTPPSMACSVYNGKLKLLCAQLKPKRHEYQEEMIRNYLECAHERFEDLEKAKVIKELEQLTSPKEDEDSVARCINSGCESWGTAKTSYMCAECYEQQKKREIDDYAAQPIRYGTGNSKFYTQSDMKTHDALKRLPSVKQLNHLDQTIYLSKSTFYNDTKPPAAAQQQVQLPKFSPTQQIMGSAANKNQFKDENLINLDNDRDYYNDGGGSSRSQSGSDSSRRNSGNDNTVVLTKVESVVNNLNLNNSANLSNNISANEDSNSNGVLLRKNSSNSNLNSGNLKSGFLNRCVVTLPPQSPKCVNGSGSNYLPSLKNGSFNFNINSDSNSTYVDGTSNYVTKSSSGKCRTPNCEFYGTKLSYYCSKCQQQQTTGIYKKLQTEI